MNTQRPKHQRGAIMLTIMMVMFVSMLMASTLINHFAVTEAREVEQLLAQVRADWAMRGHLNYILSRSWDESDGTSIDADDAGLCDAFGNVGTPVNSLGNCASDDPTRAQAFANISTNEIGATRDWDYPNYFLTTNAPIITDIDFDTGDGVALTVDGGLRLQMTLEDKDVGASANYFSLTGGASQFNTTAGIEIPNMWVDVCIVSLSTETACSTSDLTTTDDTGYTLIQQLLRADPT
jgi:hypothetical protein